MYIGRVRVDSNIFDQIINKERHEMENNRTSIKRSVLCSRLEKIMDGFVDRIKSHTFHESVIGDLKNIISDFESCLQMFDVKPTIEEAQREEFVDLNSYEEQKALRTKALEIACRLYHTPYFDKNQDVIEVSKRFYTYITKGE